jgi:hypothetical protein
VTEAASLLVTVGGRDVGAEALINRVVRVMGQANQTAARTGSAIGTQFSAGVGRATNSALAFQQAQARLEAQQGNLVGAANRLRNALAQQNTVTIQTIGAQRQLLSVQTQLAGGQTGLAAAFRQMGASAKSSLLGILGPAAAVGTAIQVLSAAADRAHEALLWKANLDATTASINAQLKGMRDSTQVYAAASKFGREFKLTQTEQAEAIQGAIGVIRQSKAPIEDILGVLARMQVLSPEQSLQEAAVALKALAGGDTTSLVTRFEVGRDVANQMKAEIAGGADAVAVMNKFLLDTGIGMDALKAKTVGAAGAIKEAAIQQERISKALAGESGGAGLAIIQAKTTLYQGLANALSGNANALYAAARAQDQAYNAALRRGASEAEAAKAGLEAYEEVLHRLTPLTQQVGPALDAAATAAQLLADSMRQVTATGQPLVSGMQAEIDAAVAAGTATRDHTAALQVSSDASQVDAAAKAADAAETAVMAAENQKLVDTFLALNPNIQASGAAAAAAAGGYPPLIQQLIVLAVRARDARGELAALNALANVTVPASQRVTDREFDTQADRAEVKSNQAVAANRALLAKIAADNAKAARGGAAAGRSAGAVKLSDQTKLNNTLLNDQQKYHDQAEAAATEHQQKLLDIEQEFAEKSLAAQRQNEVGKRESRGSFYRTLLLDTEGLSPQIQASLSAGYEAAFAKSQELAQAGNQAQADAYLDLKKEQLEAEAQYQSDLAKAREDGDKDLQRRLEAVHALEVAAAAEKEKQLLEGGDANVNARDKALAEEGERYAEQQGKIGTVAEQAAQRKIDAAQRAGKAVSDENVLLLEQEAILNRIGAVAPGTPAAGPLPPAPVGTPTVAGGAPAAAASLDTLAGLLEGIANAVSSAQAAITRAQGDTTSAVKGLRGSLVV